MKNETLKAFVAAALLLALDRPAQGSELPLSLAWSAPAECPNRADLLAETRSMLLDSEPSTHRSELQASVVVTEGADGKWRARVSTRRDGQLGERVLSDVDCADVSHAVALLLALALNDDGIAKPTAGVATSSASRPVRFALGLELGAASGVLPELAPFAAVRAIVDWSPVSFEVRVRAYLPTTDALPLPGARVRLSAGQLGLATCLRLPERTALNVQGCAGGAVTFLSATSSGIDRPGTGNGAWPVPFLELALRYAFSAHSSLRVSAQAAPSFAPPRYAIAGYGVFYEPPDAMFHVGIGAEHHF
jgi:hypothetical protein